jgi:hypothetical protein
MEDSKMIEVDANAFNRLVADVEAVKKVVINIQSMVDPDAILTGDENKEFDVSIENYRNKKAIDFEELKNELMI